MKNNFEFDSTSVVLEMSLIINQINAIKVRHGEEHIRSKLQLLKQKYPSPRSVSEFSFFDNTMFSSTSEMDSDNDKKILTPPKRSTSPLLLRPLPTFTTESQNECRSPIKYLPKKHKSPVPKKANSPYSPIGPR